MRGKTSSSRCAESTVNTFRIDHLNYTKFCASLTFEFFFQSDQTINQHGNTTNVLLHFCNVIILFFFLLLCCFQVKFPGLFPNLAAKDLHNPQNPTKSHKVRHFQNQLADLSNRQLKRPQQWSPVAAALHKSSAAGASLAILDWCCVFVQLRVLLLSVVTYQLVSAE